MNAVHPLKAAAPYLKAYRDQVFVLKIGGEILDDTAALDALCAQIGLLWHLGIKVVLVHGGGAGLDRLSAEMHLPVTKVAGRRVTDDQTLRAATMVFAGEAHTLLLARLRAAGLPAVGLSGVDASLLTAIKRPPVDVDGEVVDFGFVGDLKSCDPSVLKHLLSGGFLPVVAPLSGNDAGHVFNTNADTIAATLAGALKAAKVIFLLGVPGLLRDATNPATLVPHATLEDLAALEASGAIGGGMKPKLAAVKAALASGVSRVHLVSGFQADALLSEIFTNEGSGTLIEAVPIAAGVSQ
jgi:acetylglutamate kinase